MPKSKIPDWNNNVFFVMQGFLMYIINVISDKTAAINHNGVEYLIKNARGRMVIVTPIAAKKAIMARQIVWQTCHEPRMLVMPETLLAIEAALSSLAIFISFFIAFLPLFIFATIFCSTPLPF